MKTAAFIALVLCCAAVPAQQSDLDTATAQACTATLLGDRDGLRSARAMLERTESHWRSAGLGTTGLADNVATLANVLIHGRTPAFTQAQRRIARSANTPGERALLRALGDSLPWPTITRLRWENRYNRAAGAVNWVIRRAQQLLTGQFQAFFQMGNDVVFAQPRLRRATTRERKIFVLAERLASEAPGTAEALRARDEARALASKIERARRRDHLRRIRVAQEQGQWETAVALAQGGLTLWPSDDDFERLLRESDHRIGLRTRSWQRSLEVDPVADANLSAVQAELAAEALRLSLRGRPAQAREALVELARDMPAAPVSDDALLLAAIMEQSLGESASARARLTALSSQDRDSAWIAESLGNSFPFALDHEVEAAIARRRELSRRFVWQGARSVDESLYLASSSAISQGLAAPAALGAFFFIDSAFRGVALAVHNPLGAEAVVDALARLERRQGTLSPELRAMQRDRLRDLGAIDRALAVHEELPRPDPGLARRLRSQMARQMLEVARDESNPETRRRMLAHVAETHAGTDAAREALTLMRTSPFPGAHLTAEQVRAEIETLRQAGWPLAPSLTDGRTSNGEIDGVGVTVEPDGTIHYRRRNAEEWEEARAAGGDGARLAAVAAALEQQTRAVSALEERERPHVPLEVTGSLGASGIYAVPQLQRFRHVDEDLPLYE